VGFQKGNVIEEPETPSCAEKKVVEDTIPKKNASP